MIKDVKIRLVGVRELPDAAEPEVVELETTGQYYVKDDMCYVKYDEYFEGEDEPAKNLLKFNKKSMNMVKKGPVSTMMEFVKGKSASVYYDTPVGPVNMFITTKSYKVNEHDKGVKVDIDYLIDYRMDYITKSSLALEVTYL